MNLDVVSAEKVNFRDARKPWIVDRSDGIVVTYRVSNPLNRTEVEPYFESSYPFYLLRPKAKSGGVPASLKPNRPRVPLYTVGVHGGWMDGIGWDGWDGWMDAWMDAWMH
jgi:hypothetical protein